MIYTLEENNNHFDLAQLGSIKGFVSFFGPWLVTAKEECLFCLKYDLDVLGCNPYVFFCRFTDE